MKAKDNFNRRGQKARASPQKNAGRNRPAQSSQHPSQVCRQPAVTGAGQAEFAAHFGDESAPNDAGEHDLGQQPAQMGRPESANHGSTKNKSKSFQASRRAGRAVRKREQQGAGRTRRSGAVPAGLHWSSQLPVCRRAALQGSGSAKGWRRRTNVWREATSPARGFRRLTSDRQRGAIPLGAANLARPVAGSALPVFYRPLAARVERKLNMSWHHPDLYFFLCLAASLAAFLAPSIIDDELLARRRKPPVVEPRRSTVNEKAVDPPSPPKSIRHRSGST